MKPTKDMLMWCVFACSAIYAAVCWLRIRYRNTERLWEFTEKLLILVIALLVLAIVMGE